MWHRFEDYTTAPPLDEWDEPRGPSGVHLRHRTFEVVRATPRGVWLRELFAGLPSEGPPRFVLASARRRFACPTEDEAAESFRARKRRQAGIHRARAALAERALALVPPRPGHGSG
jgi:hypothetical protein